MLIFVLVVLDPEDQQICTQLLVYLLPACNSDTLHRLLDFLSTVAHHAQDTHDKDGQEVSEAPPPINTPSKT